MLDRFFGWLEDAAYSAILRGVRRAVGDVSNGQVELDEPAKLEAPKKTRRKTA